MTEAPKPRQRVVRNVAIGVLGAVAIAMMVVALAHTSPVRAFVLRRALQVVQAEYDIRLDASRLDYNLPALRMGLADVRVSAGDDEEPFFRARYITVDASFRALIGDVAFDQITVSDALVRVLRGADGTTNLPDASDSPGGEPAALSLGRLVIPNLAIELFDEPDDLTIQLSDISLDVAPGRGDLRLNAPGQVSVGGTSTRIMALEGGLRFDGRDLHLDAVTVRAPEGAMRLDGTLGLIREVPSVALKVDGTVDLARASRWGGVDQDAPQGQARVRAEARGPFSAPAVDLQLASDRATWRGFAADDVRVKAVLTTAALDLEQVDLRAAGGRVALSAVVPFDAGESRIRASWSGMDLATVAGFFRREGLLPHGSVDGELNAFGPLADLARWTVDARARVGEASNGTDRLAVPGQARLRVSQSTWQLDARHRLAGVAAVALALRGRLQPEALESSTVEGSIDLGETDLTGLMRALEATRIVSVQPGALTSGWLRGTVDVDGTFDGFQIAGRLDARELSGPGVEAPEVELSVSGDPLRPALGLVAAAERLVIAGEPFAAVVLKGTVTGSTFTVDELTAMQPTAGVASSGQVHGAGQYDLASGRYTVSARVSDWSITPTADRPLAATVDGEVAAAGIGAAVRGDGRLLVKEASWGEVPLGDLSADVRFEDEHAVLEVRAPEFDARADGRFALAPPFEAVFEANAEALDLAHLFRNVETATPIAGTARITVRASGPLEQWRAGRAVVEVASLEARAGELEVRLDGPAQLTYADERVVLDRVEVMAGGTRLSASGALPIRDVAGPSRADAVLVTVTGDLGDALRASAAAGLAAVPLSDASGPVVLLGRIVGSLEAPTVTADLELGPATARPDGGWPAVTDLRLRLHSDGRDVIIREAAASYDSARLEADGRIPLAFLGGTPGSALEPGASLRMTATNIMPGVLRGLLDETVLQQLGGRIDASANLTSSSRELADVQGELRLDRLEIDVASLPVRQRTPTRIVARDGFARIESWDWFGEGTTLTLRGQMRLSDRQSAILADGELDLRMLAPFVGEAGVTTSGSLRPRLSITGPLDNPRVDGDVVIRDAGMRLNDPRIVVTDVAARAVLTRTTAHLLSLTGTANGGALRASGDVEYGSGRLASRLSLDVDGMALDFPAGLRTESTAALALELASDAGGGVAGRLSGDVIVVRGSYTEPLALVTGLLSTLRASQVAGPRAAGTLAGGRSPALERIALDVRVLTDEDIAVRNNVARLALGADLRVIGTMASPALAGRAELREGGQLFVGRNAYLIESGTLDFANPVTIEPILHVVAVTRVSAQEIAVTLDGTPENLTTDLSSRSDPALGQADIASLLLTGRPLDELATDEAAVIGAQVLGNLSGEVLGFASRAVGLDVIRLGGPDVAVTPGDQLSLAAEVDPTSRLTFGKTLGPVDVIFSQSLRDGDAQAWIVDYRPASQVNLRLVSDDEDFRSYELRHDVSVGGARRSPSPAAGREDRPRVSEVTLRGDFGVPERRLRRELELDAGDEFDFSEWQADRDRLQRVYAGEGRLTARVSTFRVEEPDGIAITYDVSAGPRTRVAISGAELGRDVIERLETAWTQSVFDGFLLDEAREIVREALARQRYYHASVDAALTDEGEWRTLVVTVDAGSRASAIRIELDGVEEPLATDLREWMTESGVDDLAVTAAGEAERALEGYLRSRGYAQTRVTVGSAIQDGATTVVPIPVTLGPRLIVGTVRFEGGATLPPDALVTAVRLAPGEPYDPNAIEEARARLQTLLRREGFASVSVAVRQDVRSPEPIVDVVFAITEGPRQIVGEVAVTGNRGIDSDVVVRALDLEPGEPLRTDEWLQARRRIFQTGLFRRVDVSATPIEGTAAADVAPMRVRVAVEEWPALRVRYGFQLAEERPEFEVSGRDLVPGLSADVTRRTLFGRAIGVGGSLRYQRREQGARTFLRAPTLLGLPIESSLSLEFTRRPIGDSQRIDSRGGLSWEQRFRLAAPLQLSYGYRFERSRTELPDDDLIGPVPPIELRIARLNAAAAWDTRDDPADTARGSLFSATLEYAPEALGSEIRFVRSLSQAYHFRPWRRAVFASAARFGFVQALEGQDLIVSERFFAGGARTLRGVSEDGLGERDFFGDPVGGELLLVLNQEVRFPIYRWLRGVGFVDAANVFADRADVSLRDLVGSVGFGLRFATPVALVRGDYGRVVWPGSISGSSRWTFGIGHTF